jgi:3-hydroxyisobutyrate dehydrogenase-like beta-hydroxyacid dehydrogenase
MKLTNNIVFAVSLIGTAEALTMATKAGIAVEAMLEILNAGIPQLRDSDRVRKSGRAAHLRFRRDHRHSYEDVDLAVAQGEALGIPMWVCQAARRVLKHGVFQGR